MEVALKLANITDKLHYWNSLSKKKEEFLDISWKEANFYALGGLHSYAIDGMQNTSLMRALLTRSTHPSGMIMGASKALFGSDVHVSPEETLVAFLTEHLVRMCLESGVVTSFPRLLRKALAAFKSTHKDLPGVKEISLKAKYALDTYIEYKYGEGSAPITTSPYNVRVVMMIFPTIRAKFYEDQNWGILKSLIIALDVLIDVQDNFENLLRFLVLSDRRDVQAVIIAGIMFGLLHGTDNVPKRWLL